MQVQSDLARITREFEAQVLKRYEQIICLLRYRILSQVHRKEALERQPKPCQDLSLLSEADLAFLDKLSIMPIELSTLQKCWQDERQALLKFLNKIEKS